MAFGQLKRLKPWTVISSSKRGLSLSRSFRATYSRRATKTLSCLSCPVGQLTSAQGKRTTNYTSLSRVSLNCNIWHSNKKLHNQNSLLWIFKKYWIISYYYQRKRKNDKLLSLQFSTINRDRSFQKIDKRFSYILNKANLKSLSNSFKNTNILNIIKKTTYKQINMASINLKNKTTSNHFTLSPSYITHVEGYNFGEFTTGLKNIFFKKNILTLILKSKLNLLRYILKKNKFLLIKEIIIIKYIKIQSKRLLINNEKDIKILKKYYLFKTYFLYIK